MHKLLATIRNAHQFSKIEEWHINRFGNDCMLQKRLCGWNSKSTKSKNYVRNYARYIMLKNLLFNLHCGIWLLWECQNKTLI